MSERWPGGIVRATPVTPTGPLQNGTAPGVWTLDQANYWIKQGLWPTAGNFLAVEDVFSTYLYTGNGSTQTITNGIDLSGQGGLVWMKGRNNTTDRSHNLVDTVRGSNKSLFTNLTNGDATATDRITSFNSNGFGLGSSFVTNENTFNYVSWTFREAANFFDVVTFTSNSAAGASFSHSLGSSPGMVIIKCTSQSQAWFVWHRGISTDKLLYLNTTDAQQNVGVSWISVSDTNVTIIDGMLSNTQTYVAYLYAHDTSSTGLIQCGSFTTNGSGYANVNLGWEPQWVLYKSTATSGSWGIGDVMRGMPASTTTTGAGNTAARIFANSSAAESAETNYVCNVNSTGFTFHSGGYPSEPMIYIAIRRGPMRTPTSGTSVFSPNKWTSSTGSTITTNFPVDLQIGRWMGGADSNFVQTRLIGLNTTTTNSSQPYLFTDSTAAESTNGSANYGYNNTGFLVGANNTGNGWGVNFRRAPSFFDVVCFAGAAGSGFQTVAHNLGAIPELVILKRRNGASPWQTLYAPGAGALLRLNETSTANQYQTPDTYFTTNGSTYAPPTATSLFLNNLSSADNWVAYLFASCPGVSKVGSYTGTGALQTINCGFTTGARFVLIKRTDSTGDWYVWDSARGISSGNDPYLLLNSTAAEVTGTNYVDTDTTGFQVTAAAPAGINANGGSYIFLAVA